MRSAYKRACVNSAAARIFATFVLFEIPRMSPLIRKFASMLPTMGTAIVAAMAVTHITMSSSTAEKPASAGRFRFVTRDTQRLEQYLCRGSADAAVLESGPCFGGFVRIAGVGGRWAGRLRCGNAGRISGLWLGRVCRRSEPSGAGADDYLPSGARRPAAGNDGRPNSS